MTTTERSTSPRCILSKAGNPTVLALHYTADDDPLGSATWDSMGTFTLTYNSDGTVASGAWS